MSILNLWPIISWFQRKPQIKMMDHIWRTTCEKKFFGSCRECIDLHNLNINSFDSTCSSTVQSWLKVSGLFGWQILPLMIYHEETSDRREHVQKITLHSLTNVTWGALFWRRSKQLLYVCKYAQSSRSWPFCCQLDLLEVPKRCSTFHHSICLYSYIQIKLKNPLGWEVGGLEDLQVNTDPTTRFSESWSSRLAITQIGVRH